MQHVTWLLAHLLAASAAFAVLLVGMLLLRHAPKDESLLLSRAAWTTRLANLAPGLILAGIGAWLSWQVVAHILKTIPVDA